MLLAVAALCTITAFPRYGTYTLTPQLHGPGLVLDGAGAAYSPDATLHWLHDRLVGHTSARGGNVVVLRAYSKNVDDRHFYQTGNFCVGADDSDSTLRDGTTSGQLRAAH